MKHIILLLLAKLFVSPVSKSLHSSNAKIRSGMDHRYNESQENHHDIMQKIIEIHEKQKLLQFLENDRISIFQKLKTLEKTKGSGMTPLNLIAGGLMKDWDFV